MNVELIRNVFMFLLISYTISAGIKVYLEIVDEQEKEYRKTVKVLKTIKNIITISIFSTLAVIVFYVTHYL